MTTRFRGRFDGKTIVVDEPVDLPLNEPLDFEYVPPEPKLSPEEIQRRLAAWDRAGSRAVKGGNLPDEALRRENIYEPPRGL